MNRNESGEVSTFGAEQEIMNPVRRILLTVLLGAACLGASGCMTIEHLVDPKQKLRMYGGTADSYDYIEDPRQPRFGVFVRIVDLPLTVVADTALLPVTAPVQLLSD